MSPAEARMNANPHSIALDHLLALEGFSGVSTEIHPSDEVFGFLRDHLGVPEGERELRYFREGIDFAAVLDQLLRSWGRAEPVPRVLDFACGFGRVTRFLAARYGASQITASDILPAAVRFVADRFGVESFVSATDPETVELGQGYDVIFVLSLFSHLPQHRFEQWFGRLCGALAPSGILVFSTHPTPAGADETAQFQFRPLSESAILDGVEYGSTYVHPMFVREMSRRHGFQGHAWRSREVGGFQDLHVVCRDAELAARRWPGVERVVGSIDVAMTEGERFLIAGWCGSAGTSDSVTEVRLYADGQPIGAVPCTIPRADVNDAQGERWPASGWELVGDFRRVSPGLRTLAAVGVGPRGTTRCFDVRQLVIDAAGLRLAPRGGD